MLVKSVEKKIRLGFLVSGRGSNMIAILNHCKVGNLDAEPAVVISNNAGSGALEYAREEKIPAFYLSARTHPEKLDDVIIDTLKSNAVEWIILAGYMKKIGSRVLEEFQDKIFNIHPSLLPKHGGKGMFGNHVHKSVLDLGDSETGVTIHLVNGEYDKGRILAQKKIYVEPGDTLEKLAARVIKVEHELYSEVLQCVIENKIKL